jgi:transcriptional regulator with XRE-family HTH domain
MTPEQAFGKVLREVRESQGFSQEYLALESGYSREYISMIERGGRNPTLAAIFRLARVLSVSPTELLRRTEANRPIVVQRER